MITVIGGSGFIGSRLCCLLAEHGVDFEIIDLIPSVSFPGRTKIADIRDIEALRSAVSGDIIVHLAAVHRDDVRNRELYYKTNVDGTANVCAVAEEKDIRHIIFTSTVAVYGFCAPNTDECGAINPFNDYGFSKHKGEERLRAWRAKAPGVHNLTVIRPTVVFGEGNRGNVYNLFRQISSGIFLMVGGGKNVKSIAYVGNVVEFIKYVCENPKDYAIYNYVDKPDFDMNELISIILRKLKGRDRPWLRIPYSIAYAVGFFADIIAIISNRNFPISRVRVRKFCATTQFSSSVHNLADFKAPFSLLTAIEKVLTSEFIEKDPNRELFYSE